MRRILRYAMVFSLLMLVLVSFLSPASSADGKGETVYVVPITETVEKGLASFLKRSVNEARERDADHIIFEVNTPGGRVDAAAEIANLFQSIEIPNTAYVVQEALSAGSYISLNADQIYMKPNTTMGSAGVITSDGNAASKKAQSDWVKKMRTAAELNNRDPLYAEAMANPDVDLPKYKAGKGKYLTLSAAEALEVGYAEGVVDSREQLLSELGLSDSEIITTNPTFTERLARLITHPVVVPILLSVASLGFVAELYSPGFGIAGSMGLLALGLFFYGHMIAGLAGYEAIILFGLGVVCIVLEFFVPGGILGIIGTGGVVGSLFMSTDDIGHMTMSLLIAIIVAIIGSVILFKTIGFDKGFLRNIVLSDSTSSEKGYLSSNNREDLIGNIGKAVTPLRPSGTGIFNDERVDVVTEGSFISTGASIKIVRVEGSRIVVREVKQEKE
ncbi:NfeD family protein [Pontibacillus salipaludis]|uniref:Membrane-bound serine protease (ClpP class) n=1 Tax=Pontibacillus salipaludis TaxID=1697394 RepID=A0ABQ1PVE1_9BACI|nr:nodulation protein NfeD [Pontibacillus salipaludis]GGD04476.1 hypothetical protein GCM10011389_10000 [Pontibacillus salipaludis]